MEQQYYYVAVRKDIPIEDALCQISHASIDAGREFRVPKDTYVCVLQVPSEHALLYLSRQLHRAGVDHLLQHEPDASMGYTSLISVPLAGEARKVFLQYSKYVYGSDSELVTVQGTP